MRPSRRIGRSPVLTVASAFLVLGIANSAGAQHTPDPYNIVGVYNRQYEPYLYAMEPDSDAGMSNQDRLTGGRGMARGGAVSEYGDEADSLDGRTPSGHQRGGAGVSYLEAYRSLDRSLGRNYKLSEKDETFYSDQQARDKKYFEAMRQSDPKKRAQMLRDFNTDKGRPEKGSIGSDRAAAADNRFSSRSRLNPEDEDEDVSPPTSRRGPSTTGASGPRRIGPSASGPTPPRPRSAGPVAPDSGPVAPSSRTSPRRRSSPLSPSSRSPMSPSEVLRRSNMLDRNSRTRSPSTESGPVAPEPPLD